MNDKQTKKAKSAAENYFETGFHCAESVVAAVLEIKGEEAGEAISHATAFGGGFGKTFNQACGALSGAMIVIGHFYGREKRGEGWEMPANLGAEIQAYFIQQYKTAHCGTLRQEFGEEQQHERCKALTGNITAKLIELLDRFSKPLPEVAIQSSSENLDKCG